MTKFKKQVTSITCPRCKKHLLIKTMFLKWQTYKCPDCLPTDDSCGVNVPTYFSPEMIVGPRITVKPEAVAVQGSLF